MADTKTTEANAMLAEAQRILDETAAKKAAKAAPPETSGSSDSGTKQVKATITCRVRTAKFGHRDPNGVVVRKEIGDIVELTPNQVKNWADRVEVV